MIVQKIRDWLKDGSYLQGVALYRQVGGPYPISNFEGYLEAPFVPTDVERRLRYALELYVSEAPAFEEPIVQAPAAAAPPAPKQVTIQQQAPHQPEQQEPEPILRLRNQAKQLHKQHDDLKSRLNLMVEEADRFSDQERYAVALQLMDKVIPQLDGIYDRIREWQKTGKLPAVAKSDVIRDTVKKMQKIATLKSRISKLKGMLKKPMLEEDKQRYEQELLEKQVEVKGLEEELGIE